MVIAHWFHYLRPGLREGIEHTFMSRATEQHGALRTETPQPGLLPRDLVEAASRRLGILALIWAGLWALALVVNNFLDPVISPGQRLDDAFPVPGNMVAAVMIAVSAALFLYTRHQACDCEMSLTLGLVYEVALAAAIGFLNQVTPNTTTEGVSWICVLILVHAMVVPSGRGSILFAGAIAASMDPFGALVAWLRGTGCVPLYNLMEDAATAEISRTQVWQWIHHKKKLEDGRDITFELANQFLTEELAKIKAAIGEERYAKSKFKLAAECFEKMTRSPKFPDFLTLAAYQYLE